MTECRPGITSCDYGLVEGATASHMIAIRGIVNAWNYRALR